MRAVDITPGLERRKNVSRISYSTLYVSRTHVGFSGKLGIGFVKRTKAGVRKTLNGRVKWYHSCATSLVDALRTVRSHYSIKVPSSGWDKIRVKHYNTTEVDQLVAASINSL